MKDANHGTFFVRHDLMHYAVETTLGFREAFWGLLAGLDGRPAWAIETFLERGGSRRLPTQAVLTEFIVGRLDQSALFDDKPISADELNQHLRMSFTNAGAPQPAIDISQEQIDRILHVFINLFAQYQALPEGGHLELAFPPESGPTEPESAWPKATLRPALPRHS
jgi:hypothetical protein